MDSSSSVDDRIERALRMSLVNSIVGNDRIARQFGLLVTDAQTLHLLVLRGDVRTANQLSKATGMPTSTVTRVLDRLEDAGFIRRVPDPADRRRSNLEIVTEQLQQLAARYSGDSMRLRDVNARFTDTELETIARYLEETVDAFRHSGEESSVDAFDADPRPVLSTAREATTSR